MVSDDGVVSQMRLPLDEHLESDGSNEPNQQDPLDEMTLARELVLRAHPHVVQELVTGMTLAELLASVPSAEAAFARVAASVRDTPDTQPNTDSVPGGGAVRSTGVNLDGLGPLAKIRAGLGRD